MERDGEGMGYGMGYGMDRLEFEVILGVDVGYLNEMLFSLRFIAIDLW